MRKLGNLTYPRLSMYSQYVHHPHENVPNILHASPSDKFTLHQFVTHRESPSVGDSWHIGYKGSKRQIYSE